MKSVALVLFGLLIVLPVAAFAQPDIQAVDGVVADGDIVTIRGLHFGTKSPAAPIKWETFDHPSASDGTLLHSVQPEWLGSGWSQEGELSENRWEGLRYYDGHSHSGSYSVAHHSDSTWEDHEHTHTSVYTNFGLVDELFCSYWFRFVGGTSSDYSMNIKMARLNSYSGAPWVGSPAHPNWYNGAGSTSMNNLNPAGSSRADLDFNTSDGNTDMRSEDNREVYMDVQMGVWNKIDVYKKLSTPGVADGAAFGWNSTTLDHDMENYAVATRAASDTLHLDTVAMGAMWANQYNTSVQFALAIDDVYIDNTLSRIEIGNNADFHSCSHREMQLPVTWNSEGTVLTAEINQGALPAGKAWLFVVDADGAISDGYEITFGEAVEGPPVPNEGWWE